MPVTTPPTPNRNPAAAPDAGGALNRGIRRLGNSIPFGDNISTVTPGSVSPYDPPLAFDSVPPAGVPVALTALSEAGTTVTATTASAHGLSVGQSVLIAGVTPAGYNGTFTVTGVSSPTQFTYTAAGSLGPVTVLGTAIATFATKTGDASSEGSDPSHSPGRRG